jgi:DNA-directed RNA polymerase subunit RPC12/RpoP
MTRKISLKVIAAPATGPILEAPPVLSASDQSVDYTCGHCGTTLRHANESQVFGLLIRCTNCGSCNATDA